MVCARLPQIHEAEISEIPPEISASPPASPPASPLGLRDAAAGETPGALKVAPMEEKSQGKPRGNRGGRAPSAVMVMPNVA